jgi:hypothetical protein
LRRRWSRARLLPRWRALLGSTRARCSGGSKSFALRRWRRRCFCT